ncbi:MAG: hypothetical protein K6F16_00895 [Lachnospiraceae bacterium]|nr:hypothetical protein [Lachnospiraceae bacterium]
MSDDIRKNIVDETAKNSDNIVDIEAFADGYEADAEFENLIKNGLDKSWDDLGLSVSDDLIARTMGAIRSADDAAKAFPGSAEPAVKAVRSAEPAAVAGQTAQKRPVNWRRISRIAAGIAAAALIGIFGIGVLRSGLFMSKSSSNDAAAPASIANTAVNSIAMEATDASENGGSSYKADTPAYTSNAADEAVMQDAGEWDESDGREGSTVIDESKYIASTGAKERSDELPGSTESVTEQMATAAPVSDCTGLVDGLPDDMPDSDEETGFFPNDASGNDDGLMNSCYNIESEDLRDQIIEYIESVEGEVISDGIGFGNRTEGAEPLIMVIWHENEEDAAGISRYKEYYYAVYPDDMDFHTGFPFSSNLSDYHTETRALTDGNAVAAHLREMIGSGQTE